MKKIIEEIRTSNLVLYDFTMVSVNNRYQISALGVHGKTRTKPICSTAKQRRFANCMAKQYLQ
jgi:hypothetical protein